MELWKMVKKNKEIELYCTKIYNNNKKKIPDVAATIPVCTVSNQPLQVRHFF